jgi:microcystin-dependent protein
MVVSTNSGTGTSPSNSVLASGSNVSIYRPSVIPNQPMNATAITPVGGSQPHENMQPFLVISFIISLFGIYPNPT